VNESFDSEVLPSDSIVTNDDNINGVWIPAGGKVNLGQFGASCLTDAGVCQNFTVSFLFKINGSIPENETVDIIHQMPQADAEYLVHFSVHNNGSHYVGGATVARGHNRTDVTAVIQQIDRWIHVAIVYTKADYLELFLNGTKDQSNASSVDFNGFIGANMTLGSSNSSNGFFVSYLQIIQVTISQAEVTALKDESFTQATNPNRTTVTVSQSSRAFGESDGAVTIFIEREGNLALVSVVMYSLSNGTASSSDFTFQDSQNGKLIFKPGEILKSLSVQIVNNTKAEMNETIALSLDSNDGVTYVPGIVQIFILDDDIDECVSGPCQNNGTCTDLVLDYNCSCTPGFTGKNCSQDAYLWYLFPTGANRVYGYEPVTNQSFESHALSPGTNVSIKDNSYSLHIPKGNEVILGQFADPCLESGSVCDSFTISLLVYIDGSVQLDEKVNVLDTKSLSRGLYHVEFMVTKKRARLEGHAFIVGGNSSTLLERKVEFPASDTWVHVAIVYSLSGSLDLYMNSVMVTASDPVISTPWQNDGSAVQVSLGSTLNKRDIFVSYFQIIKGSLSTEEVAQLEQETRKQATSPSMAQLELSQENIVESEDTGLLTIPLSRTGNLVIASVVEFFIKNKMFTSSSQEVVIRPGERFGNVSVLIMDDQVPEENDTFSVTVSPSDSVTIFSQRTVNITILDDDVDDCADSPCQNYGTCNDLGNDYNCTCIPGYTGRNCTQVSYLWYLFPTGGSRIYGYDTRSNQSFQSNVLPAGANVTQKDGFRGLCIPMKKEVVLGPFANQCLGNSSSCDNFTISFLAYVNGAVAENEEVHILYSTPLTQGLFHVQFTVTRTVSRLEGQAYIVGGNSTTLLERKGLFPGVNTWVHVAIVYSQSVQELELYMNSVKVTEPTAAIPWDNSGSAVNVSLASTGNIKEICVSYFQIIVDAITEEEIQQLEQESRTQASTPSTAEAKFVNANVAVNEDFGELIVPVVREGNVLIASVLTFKSINEDAIFRVDFDHLLNQELIIKPGENSAEISVNVTEDILPENNETFLLTLMSLDKVTIIPSGSARITILNNDIDDCAIGPCKNRGTCEDLVNDFKCTCSSGFTGKTCSDDIDECSASPCKNGGVCTNLMNDYSCKCTAGFEGKNCSSVSPLVDEDEDEVLRILFWVCVGALAVSLLALIIAVPYFCHKLKRTAKLKQRGSRNGRHYTGEL